MERRKLGSTGLEVCCLALGTVELGVDYGIPVPGQYGRPARDDAIRLLETAADAGVNLFDTAPSYGTSEELVGAALGKRSDCLLATKIAVPDGEVSGAALRRSLSRSLARSMRQLKRDVLDIVQIHNATEQVIRRGEITEFLCRAQGKGAVRFLGASVYDEPAALAAIRTGAFQVLQAAYNLLDRRMGAEVIPQARAAGMGVLIRSPLLKGALTARAQWLPDELAPLRIAVERIRSELEVSWDELPARAIQFSLSPPGVSCVLFGARTLREFWKAIAAACRGPFPAGLPHASLAADALAMLNPSTWAIP